MKWVMDNHGHGAAQRQKVYIGNLCLQVYGSKGDWSFHLGRHFNWSLFCLHSEGNFDTQAEAKKAAERWFSEWVIEQFQSNGTQVEPEWYTEQKGGL
jgi:hypothetical protein